MTVPLILCELYRQNSCPHLFRLQEEGDLAGNGVYNPTDKEEVRKHMEAGQAVKASLFPYERIGCMGLQGASLQ